MFTIFQGGKKERNKNKKQKRREESSAKVLYYLTRVWPSKTTKKYCTCQSCSGVLHSFTGTLHLALLGFGVPDHQTPATSSPTQTAETPASRKKGKKKKEEGKKKGKKKGKKEGPTTFPSIVFTNTWWLTNCERRGGWGTFPPALP